MMNFSKKLIFLTGILAATFLVAAESTGCTPEQPEERVPNQGEGLKEGQMNGAYGAPARYDVRGSLDMYITGSFLYWISHLDGTDLGVVYPNDPVSHHGWVSHMNDKYKPAFKVGLGINLGYDNWDMYLEYLRYNTKSKHAVGSKSTTSLFSLWSSDSIPVSKVSSKLEQDFNLFDLMLGRAYYLGTSLTLNPHCGFRGGWLDYEYIAVTTATDGSRESSFNKQDTWVIGPRVGADVNWLLGEGFRIFFNMNAALLYQQFEVQYKHRIVGSAVDVNEKEEIKNRLTPNFDLAVGLSWGTYFADQDWHVDLSAGYEFHTFLSQNHFRSLFEKVQGTQNGTQLIPVAGDLILHGLTVSARFDF